MASVIGTRRGNDHPHPKGRIADRHFDSSRSFLLFPNNFHEAVAASCSFRSRTVRGRTHIAILLSSLNRLEPLVVVDAPRRQALSLARIIRYDRVRVYPPPNRLRRVRGETRLPRWVASMKNRRRGSIPCCARGSKARITPSMPSRRNC